jgi:hypothetical protein
MERNYYNVLSQTNKIKTGINWLRAGCRSGFIVYANFQVPQNAGNLLTSWATSSFSKGLCCTELVKVVSLLLGQIQKTFEEGVKLHTISQISRKCRWIVISMLRPLYCWGKVQVAIKQAELVCSKCKHSAIISAVMDCWSTSVKQTQDVVRKYRNISMFSRVKTTETDYYFFNICCYLPSR